jgi:hypothetical protein
VIDVIVVDPTLLLPELTVLAEKQNPQLESLIIRKRVAELQLKQVKATLSNDKSKYGLYFL